MFRGWSDGLMLLAFVLGFGIPILVGAHFVVLLRARQRFGNGIGSVTRPT
jgi:hypothetical protein